MDAIKRNVENLTQASHKLAAAMYEGAGAAGAQSPGGESAGEAQPSSDEDVIDAEYEVKE